jgi:hypothetical protein
VWADAAGPGEALGRGAPHCWQNLKPDGVWPPQDGQLTLAAWPLGASSGEPHILQNFIPGAFRVPHALQTGAGASSCEERFLVGPAWVLGASAAPRGVPQDWQKRDPSRLSLPQFEQSDMTTPSSPRPGVD